MRLRLHMNVWPCTAAPLKRKAVKQKNKPFINGMSPFILILSCVGHSP